jgi:hypothetical protein
MAIEGKRGCGYRKIGGLYLCGDYIPVECDRLPLELTTCPVCGAGIHFTRSFTEINPLKLFGYHQPCHDAFRPCIVCDPKDETAYVMVVGSKYYTPQSFVEEAAAMGISKRIPFIPKNLEPGKTVVYLAHPKAVCVQEPLAVQAAMTIVAEVDEPQMRLLDAEKKPHYAMGVFCAFLPQRIEKLIWESQGTPEELEKLEKRGVTPILVPDGDEDHR